MVEQVERKMTVEEHVDTALLFLEQGRKELDAGDIMQGSEKLWGAAAHVSMAMEEQRGWPHGSHREMKNGVLRFADEQNDRTIRLGFGVAEKFHRNFYNNTMPQFEIDADREDVALFVRQMADLIRPGRG